MTNPDATAEALVTVVIPAYDAAETLAETLASVRAQTWRNLEIIVVDDGSRDDTLQLAQRIAEDDERIRVLGQANAGVAAARNHGIREARGTFLAFVDADDLWSPNKIEAQMAALMAAGEEAGLAYCWSARIDGDSVVSTDWDRPRLAGAVLARLFRGNFVGNGSAALVRRDIAEAVGGFDSRLHNLGAQGCEDIMFYLKVAELAHFVVVEEHLVGYRVLDGNMSSDPQRMVRSWMLVADEMEQLHPRYRHDILSGVANYGYWLFEGTLRRRRPGPAFAFLHWFLRQRPGLLPRVVACAIGAVIFHLRVRVSYSLRYRMKLLPPHAGKPVPRIYGRRFRSGPVAE